MYFGFKSYFPEMYENNIIILEEKLKLIIDNENINMNNYTDPEIIYKKLYNDNTLLNEILHLYYLFESTKVEKADLTNIGTNKINYFLTYYCQLFLKSDDFTASFYSNKNYENNTLLSYSDFVYLNYLSKLYESNFGIENFLLLLENDYLNTNIKSDVIANIQEIITITKKNNIFIIFKYALEVKQNILSEITYYINNKNFLRKKYTEKKYLELTKELFSFYAINENFNYPDLEVPEWCNNYYNY